MTGEYILQRLEALEARVDALLGKLDKLSEHVCKTGRWIIRDMNNARLVCVECGTIFCEAPMVPAGYTGNVPLDDLVPMKEEEVH